MKNSHYVIKDMFRVVSFEFEFRFGLIFFSFMKKHDTDKGIVHVLCKQKNYSNVILIKFYVCDLCLNVQFLSN